MRAEYEIYLFLLSQEFSWPLLLAKRDEVLIIITSFYGNRDEFCPILLCLNFTIKILFSPSLLRQIEDRLP